VARPDSSPPVLLNSLPFVCVCVCTYSNLEQSMPTRINAREQPNAILGNLTFSSRLQFFRLLVVYESWSGEKWKKKVGHFVPTFPGLRPRTTVTATRRVFRQGFPLASFRRVGGSDGAFATRFFIRVSKPSISNSPAYSKLLFANWYSPYHFFGMDEM
jgi:hypothetical protein